jgi:hypothetical protein
MADKKARNFKNLSPPQKAAYEDGDLENQVGTSGLTNAGFVEPVPSYDSTTAEKIISNDHNAWIVLGRDRPAGISSGYGGLGHTGAGSVDIVVGRMGGTTSGPDSNITVVPSFFSDAARIHISQKTDIDDNFALVGNARSLEKSGIGIKADAVRVIGREGVKIVTGKAKNVDGAGNGGEKNSTGGKIEKVAGIELIAGNDVDAEPLEAIAKSEALSETLQEIVDSIRDLNNIVNDLFKTQTQINRAISSHVHPIQIGQVQLSTNPSNDLGSTISIKESSKMSGFQNLSKHKVNLKVGLETDHLSPIGKKWYGSRFNKTN